jgi:hypothetical protein
MAGTMFGCVIAGALVGSGVVLGRAHGTGAVMMSATGVMVADPFPLQRWPVGCQLVVQLGLGGVWSELGAVMLSPTGRQRAAPVRATSQEFWRSWIWPGCVVETTCQESQVILRMTTVMGSPISGSALGSPAATRAALAMTPSETKPSMRAWFPSAIRAGPPDPGAAGRRRDARLHDDGAQPMTDRGQKTSSGL